MGWVRCAGWWEQAGYGRQPMEELVLLFKDGQISGSGIDVIGPFTLVGDLQEQRIYLLKQYIDQHQIEYVGTSLGEGAYGGRWSCDGWLGESWFIRVVGLADQAEQVGVAVEMG